MLISEPAANQFESIAILPGSFNPPTRAHVALAEAVLADVDAVLFALPQDFPHKGWDGARREERLQMLERIAQRHPRFGVLLTSGGLFIEMAREVRHRWPQAKVSVICGRDAAERIIGWQYDPGDSIEKQLNEYRLLVAERQGVYDVPLHLREQVRTITLPGYDEISATEVRESIRSGRAWEHLVPEEVVELVGRIYG